MLKRLIKTKTAFSGAILPLISLFLFSVTELGFGAENYMDWSYRRDISLNTTSSGANVATTVTSFPVLIRLDSTNFNFTQANANGSDIRFQKSDGSPLPYAIDNWDPTAKRASIWVKVDSVYGNARTRLKLHWGNPNAVDSSKSQIVFSTSNNFYSVLHMNDSVGDNITGLLDATSNGLGGTPLNFKNDLLVNGGTGKKSLIGKGVQLSKVSPYDDHMEWSSTVDNASSLTLSAWISPSIGLIGGKIIIGRTSTGGKGAYDLNTGASGITPSFSVVNSINAEATVTSSVTIPRNAYSYVTAVYDGSSIKIFINGKNASSTNVAISGVLKNTDWGTRIGAWDGAFSQYAGYIDEVRMENIARSPDWIRLNYQNQQPNDSLVKLQDLSMWTGAVSSSWNNAGNWSPATIPTSTSTVMFSNNSFPCNLDIDATVSSVFFDNTYTGKFDFTTHTITISGQSADFRSGGVVARGTGKIIFTNTSALSFAPSKDTLPDIIVNGISSTTVSATNLLAASLTITKGTFVLGSGLQTILSNGITGDAGVADTLDINNATLQINNPGATVDISSIAIKNSTNGKLIIGGSVISNVTLPTGNRFKVIRSPITGGKLTFVTNGISCDTLDFNGTAGTVDFGAGLTHTIGTITSANNGVTVNFNSSNVNIDGNLDLNATLSYGSSGTIGFTKTTGVQIVSCKAALTLPFISHTGTGTIQLANAITAAGFNQTAGVFNLNKFNVTIPGTGNLALSNGNLSSLIGLPNTIITVGGNATFSGKSGATFGLSADTTFSLKVSGTLVATYSWIKNCDASSGNTGNADATCIDNLGNKNWVFVGKPPTANFTATPTSALVGTNIQFKDSSVGLISSYLWDFGDGTTARTKDTVHAYTTANTYTVKLTVVSAGGVDSITKINYINIYTPSGNPVQITGKYLSATKVILNFSNYSQIDINKFPTIDSLKLYFTKDSLPSAVAGTLTPKKAYIISRIMNVANFSDTIDVPAPTTQNTLYGFMTSLHSVDGQLTPFSPGNGTLVLMADTASLPNDLQIAGSYLAGDSAVISISNGQTLVTTDSIAVWYGNIDSADFSNKSFTKWYGASQVSGGTLTHQIKNALFSGGEIKIYCAVIRKSQQGQFSKVNKSNFLAGRKRPDNLITMQGNALNASTIVLNWSPFPNGVDSVRIYGDIAEIPIVADISKIFYSKTVSSPTIVDTVPGLTGATKYYFAAQVYSKVSQLWSSTTPLSSTSITTPLGGTSQVEKIAKIKKITFDSLTETISVQWYFVKSPSEQLRWNYTFSTEQSDSTKPPTLAKSIENSNDTMSFEIDLRRTISFNSTYHVWVWLKSDTGAWTPPNSDGTGTVQTTGLSFQIVDYFQQNATISALNGNVILRKGPAGWSGSTYWTDTIHTFVQEIVPSGFKAFTPGFRFSKKDRSPKFYFGFSCKNIPAPYSINDVKIYSIDNDGNWNFCGEPEVDNVNMTVSILSLPEEEVYAYYAMIDLAVPVCKITSDTAVSVDQAQGITYEYQVTDNVNNVRTIFQFAKGGDGEFKADTSYGTKQTTFTVPGSFVTSDNGVRIYMYVDDGKNPRKYDLSRRVVRAISDPISVDAGVWIPFRSTGILDNQSIENAIVGPLIEGKWNYDVSKFRIFRWYPNGTGLVYTKENWVEFSEANKSAFKMEPGTMFWLKSAKAGNFNLGPGTTVSLKDTNFIQLEPGQWTDLALPFRFDVNLGEIMKATGQDTINLTFSKWERNTQKQFKSVAVWTTGLQEAKGIVLSCADNEGYSVYNAATTRIRLQIPPVPAELTFNNSFGKRHNNGSWAISITGKTEGFGEISGALCGQTNQVSGKKCIPSGPSFSDFHIGIVDQSTGKTYGYLLKGRSSETGSVWQVSFRNSSMNPGTIEWTTESVLDPSVLSKARVYDLSTNSWSDPIAKQTVSLAANSEEYRYIIIGDAQFMESFQNKLASLKTGLNTVYPNPFRGNTVVRYTLGKDKFKKLHFALYDGLGRAMWSKTLPRVPSPGNQAVQINMNEMKNQRLATGAYLLVMTAIDNKNRPVYYKQRVTYMP